MASCGLCLAVLVTCLVSFCCFLLGLSFLFAIDIMSNINVNALSEIQITQVLTLIYFYSSEMKIPNRIKTFIINSRPCNIGTQIKTFKQFLVVGEVTVSSDQLVQLFRKAICTIY